ncbi:FkbM family methyltransferase [Flavobacterium psychrophilum]|nr:FkbM family methyltransferase [Flavobacterium psychrophilum]
MKFKKLRKIYRVLFPVKISETEQFFQKLNNLTILNKIEKSKDFYSVTTKKENLLIIRNEKFSDFEVFNQIFIEDEYLSVIKIIDINNLVGDNGFVMIDAGANVGYTSVYFANHYKKGLILGIEPSFDNFNVYKENIKVVKEIEIIGYQKALSPIKGVKYDIDRSFRDGKDWSISTNENGIIEGITIQELINEKQIENVTLLKIDIEGAERFIFTLDNDVSFLKIVKVIAIEIHDEYNCRNTIVEILKKYNFLLLETGELTIGINLGFI